MKSASREEIQFETTTKGFSVSNGGETRGPSRRRNKIQG